MKAFARAVALSLALASTPVFGLDVTVDDDGRSPSIELAMWSVS
jgi:hypothetical protein